MNHMDELKAKAEMRREEFLEAETKRRAEEQHQAEADADRRRQVEALEAIAKACERIALYLNTISDTVSDTEMGPCIAINNVYG